MAFKPWCAARKCPVSPQACAGYIAEYSGNKTAQFFVACCQIQCGRSANDGLVALECGGATTAFAVGTMIYLLLLLVVGGYILVLGPFLKMKNVTWYIIAVGALIFTTGTSAFISVVTSPFMVLQSVPALGAMIVAVFSYFHSGFRYGVGLAYEAAPLFAFASTSFPIWKALVESTPQAGPLRTANHLAYAMHVFTFLWIVHTISYRLYGYRVDWRLGHRRPKHGEGVQDPRFHMAAAQGHPTWRTPLGQSTSVVITVLAWWMVGVVSKDLAVQECRPDWFLKAMLYGAPCLISVTILWNLCSGIRCRTIEGLEYTSSNGNNVSRSKVLAFFEYIMDYTGLSYESVPKDLVYYECKSEYPGYSAYKYFVESNFRPWSGERFYVWTEYVQAAALQRMERNSLFVEDVPENRLQSSDKVIGCLAWILAQVGLVISALGFFSLMGVAEVLGRFFEAVKFRRLVVTQVKRKDRKSAVAVIEQCYIGANIAEEEMKWTAMEGTVLGQRTGSETIPGAQRSINLHTLLDNTGPCDLYNVLILPGLREPVEP